MRKPFFLRSACFVVFLVVLSGGASLTPIPAAHATAIDDLQKKKVELERQAKQADHDALLQKSVAERAAARITEVAGQISDLKGSIQSTKQAIADAQDQIYQKDQESAGLESLLRRISGQQDALLREMYITRASEPDALLVFSDKPISTREEEVARAAALKKAVASVATLTRVQQDAVAAARNDLAAKQLVLEGLKDQQNEQVTGLADIQSQQSDLRANAVVAETALETKARQARAQQQKIEDQIASELSAIVAARSRGGAINGGQNTGQRVSAGAIVGHEGSTGNSTGPHVHFECRSEGVAVNCQQFVNNGTLSYPLSNFIITQYFGEIANSYLYHGSPHTGIDLAAPYGQPVYAPASGTVILNKYYGGYGNAWAEVLDNGLVVLLGHMTGK